MICERRWHADDFSEFVLGHPLMRRLVAGVALRGWDEAGLPMGEFRTGDAGTELFDLAGEPHALDTFTEIGIAPSVHLDAKTRTAWISQFAELGRAAPFEQLRRLVEPSRPEEIRAGKFLTALEGRSLPEATFAHRISERGWEHGEPLDAGLFHEHVRPFRALGISAVLPHSGVPIMGAADKRSTKLDAIHFVEGDSARPATDALAIEDLPGGPVAEALAELAFVVTLADRAAASQR